MNPKNETTPATENVKVDKVWYKKWWGILLAILFWPVFIIWYAWAKSTWKKGAKIAATVICAFFGIQFAAAAANPTPVNTPTKQVTATQSPTPKPQVTKSVEVSASPKPAQSTKPLTIQDKLWVAVDAGLKKRDNIKVEYDQTEKVAFIEHTDENTYDAESFVRQAYALLVLYGQQAFNVDGVEILNVQNKTVFTDAHGNKNVETGVTIEMTKDQFKQFNWKNLEYQEVDTRIQAASNIYLVKPAISSQIKDNKKLYLVLRYP